jgi:hypothetical protein
LLAGNDYAMWISALTQSAILNIRGRQVRYRPIAPRSSKAALSAKAGLPGHQAEITENGWRGLVPSRKKAGTSQEVPAFDHA